MTDSADHAATARREAGFIRRLARQAGLLFSGFAAAQGLSFARNALLGHTLSAGDFGIAAAITATLQMVETLSDVGADRCLVQAAAGDEREMLATAHGLALVRGAITALLLVAAAPFMAAFLGLEAWRHLFAATAAVPLLKGLVHLEQRQAQRRLDNRVFIGTEVGSQALALALLPLAVRLDGSAATVLWLALVQAVTAIALSHGAARTRWRPDLDPERLKRYLAFGWPLWISAFPLVAVYQADRILVGRMLGMEALAAYAAAFLVTMVPGLVAAKAGQSLMLPLLSGARDDHATFRRLFAGLSEANVLLAAAYAAGFLIAGGAALAFAFGRKYAGLDALVGMLAGMWALRMVQATPGMALMALGITRPLLYAGLVRALSLPLAVGLVLSGFGLEGVAAAAIAGEALSFVYVLMALRSLPVPGLARITLMRSALLLPVIAVAALTTIELSSLSPGLPGRLVAAVTLTTSALALLIAVLPEARGLARRILRGGPAATVAAPVG